MDTSFDISAMKVPELKKELKKRGLSVTGNKLELVDRLQIAMMSSDVEIKADDLLDESEEVSNPPSGVTSNEPSASLPKKESATVPSSETTSVKQVVANPSKTQTDQDKATARLQRFGASATPQNNDEALKKAERAKRFGLPVAQTSAPSNGADLELLKKRAERFGAVSSANLKQLEDGEKLKRREERFGKVTKDEPPAKKGLFELNKSLVATKVDPETAEKLRKRAERFGLAQ